MKVNFLATATPAAIPEAISHVMNWAQQNGFKITFIINSLLPQNSRIQKPTGQVGFQPMNLIYCKSSRRKFKKYFGFEYSEERLKEIPQIIAKKQNAKEKI